MAKGWTLAARRAEEEEREARIQEAFRRAKVSDRRFGSVFVVTPFRSLDRKCRKIAEHPQAWVVLHRLLRYQHRWVRDLKNWKPKGKAVGTILRSLVRHLICQYPMPAFWFEVWFRGTGDFWDGQEVRGDLGNLHMVDNFVDLAQGLGMHKLVKAGRFSAAFTKKQCHAFMQQKKVKTIVHAVRWTQVQSYGGDRPLAETLCATEWGDLLGGQRTESFRAKVIQWFSAQGMLDPVQVGPLIDYIDNCRRLNNEWAIKGRTVVSLMRDMEAWHRDLAAEQQANRRAIQSSYRNPPPEKFKPCGVDDWFHNRQIKDPRTGKKRSENHTITEILTYKRLHEEGKALRHCVTSYAWNIGRRSLSIWSYAVDKEKTLTIELHNSTKTVRQIRGDWNRLPTPAEMTWVQKWAKENGILIASRAVGVRW